MTEQPSKGSQLLASGKQFLSSLPKDLNSLRQQTTPLLYRHEDTLALQLYIRSLRAVKDDLNALSRDSSVASKNLYEWAKDDSGADIVDIFDRAAFLQFKTSELEQIAAGKFEEARILIKDIRNFENDLSTRRKNRATHLAKLKTLKEKDTRGKNAEQIQVMSNELHQLDHEIETFDQSFTALKRQKLHEAFALQYAAQKELGEKLAIVSGYGELLLQGMESDGTGLDYTGKDRTAQVKAELEEALAVWQPTATPVLSNRGSSSLSHSDTRSFGTTHADQLSQLGSDDASPRPTHNAQTSHSRESSSSSHPGSQLHYVPPLPTIVGTPAGSEEPHKRAVPPIPTHQSAYQPPTSPRKSPLPPVAPHGLNLSPTPQDLGASFSPPTSSMSVPQPPAGVSPPHPTMGETGVPKVGTGGPTSGQLRPRSSSNANQVTPPSQLGGGAAGVDELSPLPPAETSSVPQTSSSSFERSESRMPGSLPMDDAGWGGVERNPSMSTQGGAGGAASETLPAYGEGDEEAMRANNEAERILAAEREQKGRS